MPTTRHGGDRPGRRELLLDLLRDSPQPRTILSLADELGVHANTVRFHLDALLRGGQVEQVLADTTGPGRPPALFRATRRMDPDGPTNYRLLARMLTSHLVATSPDAAGTATELGRAWAPKLVEPTAARGHRTDRRPTRGEALTHVTTVLADLGFAPEPPTGPRDTSIRLRHCPFLDLVTSADTGTVGSTDGVTRTHPNRVARAEGGDGAVICSLHLGLMQGAFASLNGPVTVDRLDPLVEPDLCVAHLAPTAGRGHRDE